MQRLSHSIIVMLLITGLSGWIACKQKPLTKEEATQQIISGLLDACKGGKTEDAAAKWNAIMPDDDRKRGREINVATPEGKRNAERMCQQLNTKYGGGYEFGKFINQPQSDGSEVVGWEFFPKGGNQGDLWAFKLVNNQWVTVDIDPAKR